ncbi:MAG: LamG-like jellyroll fold domain-containing protein, partial [Planctomycetaceae bacterium]
MSPRRFAAWLARLIQHQPRRNVPLWVERMEDRTLLSAVFTVNTTVDSVDASPGDGVAEDSLERTSLRAAVMEANALAGSDTILVPQGSYDLALTGAESDAANDLDVTSDIRITATGSGLTTIDAQGIDRVIHVGPGGSLTLDGVEITGGNTGGSGGGVFNDGGTVDLVDVTVRGNTGTTGGGLANTGELNIDNSTISGNTGGGIHNASAASLAITRSTVTSNTALAGAGIDSDGSAEINNSIVADNTGTNENSDVAGDFTSTGFNLIGKAGAGVTGFSSDDFAGTVSSPIDPRLATIADNGGTTMTHALLAGSVAIDGGAAVVDRSGNGITASIVGDVLAGEGLLGAGVDFPGGVNNTSDDFLTVDLDRLPSNRIPTSAITVAAWARITQTGFRHEIFASQTGAGHFITHVEVLPDGTARFVLRSDADDTIINFIGGSVPFDTWFHYAATYDEASNQIDVYIDGVSIFSGPATLNLAIGSDWGLGGTIGSTTDNARPFTGQMDEFYLFTRALSSAEITTLATVPANPTGIPQVTGDLSIYYSFDDLITRATDQRSGPRVLDGDGLAGPRIDIGAFERVNDFNPDNPIPEVIQLGNITVNVEQVATGLVSPSLVVNAADGSGRIFISDQIGFVHLVKNGVVQGTPFLDITASITDTLNGNQEVGLSGFAFHPDFSVSGADGFGKFYTLVDELVDELAPVDFTHFPLPAGQDRAAQSVLREYTMNNITDDVFSGTSRELLRIDQPHDAHSAGSIVFGPNKLLYISLGDGGTHDDQGPGHNPDIGNARDLSVVYGKILRIDPFGTNSANGQYGIPANNPFVGDPTALDEILFHGLRNPFRISFETTAAGVITSKLVIGDTGQDDIEEVDRADVFDDAGGHFGWNLKEGTFLFDAGLPPDNPGGEPRIGATADSPGSPLGLIDPIVQYDHGPNGEGTAVIGGETYQGDLIPELKGMYVFGDFNESFAAPTDGRIFYADLDSANPEIFELNLVGQQISLGGGVSMFIKGFGRDENGELYVAGSTTLSSADNSGVVLRLTGTQIQADLSVTTHGDEAGPVDIEYTVMLSVPNTTGAPITFDLDDLLTGTATSGDDYTAIAANAQITVAEGASTGSLTVPVAVDASPEPVETVIAQISNPSHAFVTIGTASATANIANSTVVNLNLGNLNGTTGFQLDGVATDDSSGFSVSGAGDVNGDGFDDVIVGARLADSNGGESGSSYVVFGRSGGFTSPINLSSLNGTTGFRLDGVAADDRSGRSVKGAGDVNGDGVDDLIIGAWNADPNGSASGASYVMFGHSGPFGATIDLSSLNGTTGFRLDGAAANDRSGLSVSGAGDVNGDGFDDVIVGAQLADPNGGNSGSSYVVFGHSGAFSSSINLGSLNGTTGFRLDGAAGNDRAGIWVRSAGDVNGDGFDDVIVGAFQADPNGSDSGSSYVVFGHSGVFAASTNLSTLNGTNGFRLDGVAATDHSGLAVSGAGDVNGDGFDDLLVAARETDHNGNDSGSSYVVFGHSGVFAASTNLSSLNGTTGFRLDGAAAGDFAGFSVSDAGDVNGDGFDDLIVGAFFADPNGDSSGSTYVVYGRSSAFASTINLSSLDATTGFRLDGVAADDRSGVSVSSAGDVNGDGFDDLIIGADQADPNGNSSAGSSYVYFGSSLTGGVETQVGNASADTLTATQGTGIDILIGGQGPDTLISDGGDDVLRGGEDDDTLSIPDTTFNSRRLLGGNGTDTLVLAGSGLTLDLTTLADNRIVDIEEIDITGTGANTLTLDASAVLNISSHSNTMVVRRNSGDTVNIGSGWTQQTNEVIGLDTFEVFTQGAATLKVQQVVAAITGFTPVGAPGSLIFDPPVNGSISVAGEVDGYTISLDPGQTITVVLTATGSLQGTAEVLDTEGTLLGTSTAAAVGEDVTLQTLTAASAGAYTLNINGASGTTGDYTVEVILNAAVEVEEFGGTSNNSTATAQDLTASFIVPAAGAEQRGAVIGSAQSATDDVFSFFLNIGDSASLVTTGSVGLALLSNGGNLIASGITAANLSQAINNFVATVSDTYFAVISSTTDNEDYSLVVTRNLDFDSENNSSFDNAQDITVVGSTLGFVQDAGGAAQFDTPLVNVDGQGFNGVQPPDTVGDVGIDYYVQAINAPGG